MDMGKIFGRSMAFPPRIGETGSIAWSEGADNIRESIQIILLTELNERILHPEFGGGLRSFLYEPNTAATRRMIQERIMRALARWERRIKILSVTVDPDPHDRQAAVATIHYELVANQLQERISLSLNLAS